MAMSSGNFLLEPFLPPMQSKSAAASEFAARRAKISSLERFCFIFIGFQKSQNDFI
jgi:hypothetical protein